MNPYAMLAQSGHERQRQFFEELQRWHDDMVMHQRAVRQRGPRLCSDDCPHAEGRRLWREARSLLGAAADSLTFLRASAGESRADHARRRPARVASHARG